jgi:hypothetical protein
LSYIFFFLQPLKSPWSNPKFISALLAVGIVVGIFLLDRLSTPASIQVGSSGFNIQFAARPADTGARQPLPSPGEAFLPPASSGSAALESRRLQELSFLGATAAWIPEHEIRETLSMRRRDRWQILITDNIAFESSIRLLGFSPYSDSLWLRLIGPVYTCIYNMVKEQNDAQLLGAPRRLLGEFSSLAYIYMIDRMNLAGRRSHIPGQAELRTAEYQFDRLLTLRDEFLEAVRSYYRGRLTDQQRILDRSCSAGSFQERDALLFSQGRILGIPTLPYVPIALAILLYISGEREASYGLPALWLQSAPAPPPEDYAPRAAAASRLPRLFEVRAHTAEAFLRLYDYAGSRSVEALLALDRADEAFSRVIRSSALQDGSRMRTPRDLASSEVAASRLLKNCLAARLML